MHVEFSVDETADPDYLETLSAELGTSEADTHQQNRTWLDTHDWRLYRAGLLLEHQRHGTRPWLVLSDLEGRRISRLPAPRGAVTTATLPEGAIRDQVLDLVGIRALLPRVAVSGPVHTLAVLDKEAKTVARVVAEGPTRVEDGDDLGVVVRVDPLRGYDKQARSVTRQLEKLPHLTLAQGTPHERVFGSRGLVPGEHRSKPEQHLDPEQPVEEALAETFSQLLAILRDNLDGTLAELDTEFLHDLRVAVRRARSVAKFAEGYLPDDVLARHRTEMKWLGDATSLSRDLDVYLLGYDELTSWVGQPEALAPFHDLLQQRCRRAHTQLNRALRSKRLTALLESWADQLAVVTEPVDPPVRVADAADRLLSKAWKRVERRGAAITDDSPAEAVHDLRKRCKELRYLLELFSSLYDKASYKEFLRELKRLQENLGEFQDAEAQKFLVAEYAEELNSLDVPVSTLMAMGRLEHHLEDRQQAARDEFAQRWNWFDRRHTQRLYKQMVASR